VKREKVDQAIAREVKAEAIRSVPKVEVTPQKLKKILKRTKRGDCNK
jgi:phage gp29-like protein